MKSLKQCPSARWCGNEKVACTCDPGIATFRVGFGIILRGAGPDDVTPSPAELEASNGLIVSTHGGAAIITGVDSGTVAIELAEVAEEPIFEEGDWEETVDMSIDARHGDLRVVTVLGEPVELPPLSYAGLGTCRMRCYATGHGERWREIEVASPERYRLVVWLEPTAPVTVPRVLLNRSRV